MGLQMHAAFTFESLQQVHCDDSVKACVPVGYVLPGHASTVSSEASHSTLPQSTTAVKE